MFERKKYDLGLGEETEENRLPDSPQDPEWQEMKQVEDTEIENELSWLMDSVQNPEVWPEFMRKDPDGVFGLQPTDIKPVRLDLWQYT